MNKITDNQINKKLFSSRPIKELLKFEKKKELQTGISDIDFDFGFPTGYYLIVGNQGVGKSWFALWLARTFFKQNQIPSVYFSLEMPEQLVRKRILQQWSDLTRDQLEEQGPSQEAIDLMEKDIVVVDEFYPQDTKNRTPENFNLWVDEYYKLGYRIFLMDHFHELQGASVNETNQKTVEKWGLTFQKICKKYEDIWLIIFAQPNSRDWKKGVLDRNSIRGSKALVDKTDYVLSINNKMQLEGRKKDMDFDYDPIDEKKIYLYLDKTRYTEKPGVTFHLYFHETGNFNSKQDMVRELVF